jgi:hypothetical protein
VWLAAEWVKLGRADHLLGARMRDRCSSLSGPVSVRSDRGSLGPKGDLQLSFDLDLGLIRVERFEASFKNLECVWRDIKISSEPAKPGRWPATAQSHESAKGYALPRSSDPCPDCNTSATSSGSRGQRLAPRRFPHSLPYVFVRFAPGCPLQRLLQFARPRPSCPGGEGGDGQVPVPYDRTPQPGLD